MGKKQRAGQKEEGFCLSEAAGLASGRWRAAPSLPVHGLKDVNDGGMVVPGPVRRVPGCGVQASAAGGGPGEVVLKTLGSGKTHVLRERAL